MADASSVGLLSYDPGGGHTDQLRDLSLALIHLLVPVELYQ